MVQHREGGGLFPAGTVRDCLLLSGIFAVSRLIYYAAGIRFLANLSEHMQFADLSLLRDDLFRTVLLLHIQPPLFNLLVGSILKFSPAHAAAVFHALYMLFGLGLIISIFLLSLRLGISRRWAVILAGLFSVIPATVLLENWAFYTYPVTLLLVLAALALNLFLASGRLLWLFIMFFLAALLVLTRSMFHPLWLLLIPVGLYILLPEQRRRIVTAALVPLLVVGLWVAKNYYTVGSSSTSTLLGMNFSKITIMQLSGQQRVELYSSGKISVVGLYSPFKELDYYREKAGFVASYFPTGIPILDNERTSRGTPNFNNPAYVDISRRFLADDLAVIRYHPGAYARGVLGALSLFFQPTHDQIFSRDNVERIKPVLRVFDVLLYGQLSSLFYDNYHTDFQDRIELKRTLPDLGLFVLIAFLAVLVFWPARLIAGGLALARSVRGLTVWFMLYAFVYVTVLANLVEIGENARLRYPVEPFFWLLFALFLAARGRCSETGRTVI